MIKWLYTSWNTLASNYIKDYEDIELFWNEIEDRYSAKSRHYHNLSHIYNMLHSLDCLKPSIYDFEALQFAIWYHDIIYKSSKKDNEEKSALFAKKRLKSIGFDKKRIENVEKLIISTKKHQLILSQNIDNAYLLDLDLSILGSDWNVYKNYIENIRKEYKVYPNFIYNPGRKKVLNHFLERETLYFTKDFSNRYENQARKNLKKEIELLS